MVAAGTFCDCWDGILCYFRITIDARRIFRRRQTNTPVNENSIGSNQIMIAILSNDVWEDIHTLVSGVVIPPLWSKKHCSEYATKFKRFLREEYGIVAIGNPCALFDGVRIEYTDEDKLTLLLLRIR